MIVRLRSLQRALGLRTVHTSSSSSAGSSSTVVRCRFAPSPTGFLHIGGLRTALFNVLMVRSSAPGSKFILRIDDTDRNRYVEGAVESLTGALKWAGLHWDEGPDVKSSNFGPYFQSQRLPLYQRYIDRLLETGNAYRDFRPASSEGSGEAGQAAGVRLSSYIPPSEEESQQMIDAGRPFVVRLKMPERPITFDDLVFGHFSLNPKDLGNDPILLKSDGWPTYHLASTVDDIEMQITHVFRGEEWLPSVGKHLALFDALGAKPPHFAHLPLLINPDGTKLSKRTGDAHVQAYIDKGYEPEALINFVGLMGYNHLNVSAPDSTGGGSAEGDHSEVMDMDALIRGFDINRVARSRASPFFPKLDFLNRQHIRQITSIPDDPSSDSPQQRRKEEIIEHARTELVATFGQAADLPRDKMADILLTIGERATTVKDLVEEARFLFETPDWNAEPASKLLKSISTQKDNPPGADIGAVMRLILDTYTGELRRLSEGANDVSTESSQDPMTRVVPAVIETLNAGTPAGWKAKGLRTLAKKTLRWAVSGGKPGPAVADVINVMGADAMQTRLRTAQGAISNHL
ncbi:hypothetical protein CF326_g1656 [Tilletia indica]|nr:hypothetical protein CF326_g1656 [Tilletia indica]